MKFAPKSEQEIRDGQFWPNGPYSFEVIERAMLGGREWETCETRSQEHKKDMIQLVLRVFRQGEQKVMIDYLMPDVAGKLRHACDACGLLQRYETGEVAAADFIGRGGVLRLRIEKDRKGQYSDRNAVADYVPGSFRSPKAA